MEIKVNEEIRNIKETFLLGLSMRQTICSLIALLAGVGVYFLVKDSMALELSISLCMLAATPFACLGFVTIQGMTFEKIFVEFLKSYIVNPIELYNNPKNNFAEWKHEEEYNSADAIKMRNQKKIKKVIIFISVTVVLMIGCVIASSIGNNIAFENHKTAEFDSLMSNYKEDIYTSEQHDQLSELKNSCKEQLETIHDEKELNILLRTYKSKLNAVPTYPELLAESFTSEYSKAVESYPNLSVVMDTVVSDISSAETIDNANEQYKVAKTIMDNEIKALSK